MSTEPGKSRDGAGGSGKKAGAKTPGKSGAKTVAAASAKPPRDETTVEIASAEKDTGTAASEPKPSSSAEETRADLASIEDEPKKTDSPSPEIAPVKDTAKPSKDKPTSTSSAKPVPAEPSATWAKPAEPPGSVSTGRTDQPAKPFNAGPTPPPGNSSGPGKPAPAKPNRPSFARAVLRDRSSASPANTPAKPATDGKPARKAQLQLARLEPWSVMKFSFVMSVVCFVVLLVAVIVLYTILNALGVFDAISDTINSLTREQGETTGTVDAGNWFSFFRITGYTILVGALNVLLITALSTVGSVIYNLAADLVGGVEVTLKEAE